MFRPQEVFIRLPSGTRERKHTRCIVTVRCQSHNYANKSTVRGHSSTNIKTVNFCENEQPDTQQHKLVLSSVYLVGQGKEKAGERITEML